MSAFMMYIISALILFAGKIAEDVYELKIAIKQLPGATGDCED